MNKSVQLNGDNPLLDCTAIISGMVVLFDNKGGKESFLRMMNVNDRFVSGVRYEMALDTLASVE